MIKISTTKSKYILKILLVGEAAVGKTSLVQRFVHNQFKENYLLTVGMEPYTKIIELKEANKDPIRLTLSIWDIAGQQRFQIYRNVFYKGAHGVFLVFDLTRPASLTKLTKEWLPDVHQMTSPDLPSILIGNKADLEDKIMIDPEIDVDPVKKAANVSNYIETSAKTGENVSEAFNALATEIVSVLNKR
ncbi:MAG: Rab family GTPase [Promethearchaeota archaeon]